MSTEAFAAQYPLSIPEELPSPVDSVETTSPAASPRSLPVLPDFQPKITKQSLGLSIVIPAWNEEARLAKTLDRFLPALRARGDPFEVIVVVDGVNDLTADIARSYWAKGVKVLEYPHRLGKGGAVLAGMKLARYEYVGYLDADGPITPADMHRMLAELANVDCVVASRWTSGSQIIRHQPAIRVLSGRVWNFMVRAVLFLPLNDTQCGAKIFRRAVLDPTLKAIAITNWAFDVSLLYHLKKSGHTLKEVPIEWEHADGSRLPSVWKAGPIFLMTLLGIRVMNLPLAKSIPPKWVETFQRRWGR